jgi:alkylated DNA repair dioxygenase AlkB
MDIDPQIRINEKNSRLYVIPDFSPIYTIPVDELNLAFEPPIKGGKLQRRNIGFFSNTSIGYKYSGQMIKSQPLIAGSVLATLLADVNARLHTNFNGILINEYKNGTKYIGAHSDDESGLDKTNNIVACISFGATRKFRIHRVEGGNAILDEPTTPGKLIVMEGDFQKHFKHSIPVEKRCNEPRISLTFRHHII